MLLRGRKEICGEAFLVWCFLVCGFWFFCFGNNLLIVVFALVESGADVKKSGMFM